MLPPGRHLALQRCSCFSFALRSVAAGRQPRCVLGREYVEGTIAVQHIAPREATVYFQMGRLYKKLGDADAALTHLNHALDLKPTSTDQNLIKSAIERLHMDDDEVEDEI